MSGARAGESGELLRTGLGRLPAVGLADGVDQLALVHAAAAVDVELAGHVHQVGLRGIGVDPAGRLATAAAGRGTAASSLGVARALLRLRLPVVADLLEGV